MTKENTEQYSARRRNLGEKEKEIALKNFVSYLETHDFNTERKDCEKSMKESRASFFYRERERKRKFKPISGDQESFSKMRKISANQTFTDTWL